MRKDKYKYQIGDIVYEASLMHRSVIKYRIDNIFVETYVSDLKTVLYMTKFYDDGTEAYGCCRFAGDLHCMYDTEEEAEKALAKAQSETGETRPEQGLGSCWIENAFDKECPFCHSTIYDGDYAIDVGKFNYCPFCGMRIKRSPAWVK